MNPVPDAPHTEEPPDTGHPHTGLGLMQLLGMGLLVFLVLMVILGIVMIFFMGPLGEP